MLEMMKFSEYFLLENSLYQKNDTFFYSSRHDLQRILTQWILTSNKFIINEGFFSLFVLNSSYSHWIRISIKNTKRPFFSCGLTIFIVGLNICKKGTFHKQIELFSFPQMLINQFTKLNGLNGNHPIIKQTLIHARKYSLFGNVHCFELIRLFVIEHYWKIEMNAFLQINAINPFVSKKRAKKPINCVTHNKQSFSNKLVYLNKFT